MQSNSQNKPIFAAESNNGHAPGFDPWRRAGALFEPRIQACEKRLALSATPGAETLLELLGATTNFSDGAQGDLWEQAASLHESAGLTGAGQTIAVIDSGIAYDHVALGGGFGPGYRVVGGWDFAEGDANPYDDGPSGFHGTHVAGILAGGSNNFNGLAPEADLVALRVFSDSGAGNIDWVEDALQWVHDNRNAFEHPITTVNLSIGILIPDQLVSTIQAQLQDELAQLRNDGILVFAAAGNQYDASKPTQLAFPASNPLVVAVASENSQGNLSSFSQRNDDVFTALGEQVRSSVPDHVLGRDGRINDFSSASGTSMASPQLAAASVLLREAYLDRGLNPDPETILNHLRATADTLRDGATGLDYLRIDLDRAIGTLPPLSQQGEPSNAGSNLGGGLENPSFDHSIALSQLDGQLHSLNSNQWYEVSAERDGTFSVLNQNSASSSTHLSVYDSHGNVIPTTQTNAANQFDFRASAGAKYLMRWEGAGEVATKFINAIALDGKQLDVIGGDNNDQVELNLTSGVQINLDGFKYRYNDADVTGLDIDLGPGSNRIDVIGSAQAEKVTLRSGGGEIEQVARAITIANTAVVRVTGGGGADRGYLYDSPGNDQLELTPGIAKLSGVGFTQTLEGFARLFVHATQGGEDRASLFDSAGDDELVIRSQFTTLRGSDFFLSAYGFERVQSYASAGGFDRAELYDSSGNDRMMANATQAWISGPGYFAQSRNFEQVRAYATAGGDDIATLYATQDGDQWIRSNELVQLMSSNARTRSASGFERTETFDSTAAANVGVATLGSLQAETRGDSLAMWTAARESQPSLWIPLRKEDSIAGLPQLNPNRFAEQERAILSDVLSQGPAEALPPLPFRD